MLLVYYTYTQQSRKVADVIAAVLGDRGCDVRLAVLDGEYDLVCIGSPTWWLKTSVPVRSFMKSDTAGRLLSGEYVDGVHFVFAGGQVRSLLSLLSYFGKGENSERYLGVKIPPTNLKPDYADTVRAWVASRPGNRGRRDD